jgi:two-component system, chemotaxis family, chemotaxis protein CheY
MEAQKLVCIIDDDAIFHTILKVKIQKRSPAQRFLNFSDGKEAIDYFRKQENWTKERIPDIIFLDINMPFVDGWQFLDAFAEIEPELPKPIQIFMLSSSIDNRDLEKARSHPRVEDYITKPIADDRLANIWK